MKKTLLIKPVINKNNKQINFSLPKKQLSKEFFKNLNNKKLLKIILEDI